MRRREFLGALGGAAAAWPLAARAQQAAMPVVGFLFSESPVPVADRLRAFRQGLKETGYVEGENVAIEFRFAEGQNERLPGLAAELVHRKVAVITAIGSAALAAKATSTTIPIVFGVGEDPVRLGLVANLARPGGNATGISFPNTEVVAKRLELLRELVPGTTHVAVLLNPAFAVNAETTLRDVQSAARAMGMQIQVLDARSGREINAAFTTLMRERPPDAIFVGGDPFFNSRRVQLAILAARHAVPAAYSQRDYPEVGGLMSYGTNLADAWRQVGVHAGRILKGAKPADLPVVQASKFELVINAETARALSLTIPPMLLARADEVIESTVLLAQADCGCHAALSRSIALRVVIIFRMTATMMTLDFLLASARRLEKALRAGLCRLALRAAM